MDHELKKMTPASWAPSGNAPGVKQNLTLETTLLLPPDPTGGQSGGTPTSNEAIGSQGWRDFVNRANEWREVVYSVPDRPSQYYVFDAPPGYGKTRLLLYISEKLDARNWYSLYLKVSGCQLDLKKVAIEIAKMVSLRNSSVVGRRPEDLGLALGQLIAQQNFGEESGKEGICLIFDVDVELTETATKFLKTLTQFLPFLYDSLIHNSRYFELNPWAFRVVFAGRYISGIVQDHHKTHIIKRLKPFDYDVVRNEILRTTPGQSTVSAEVLDEFAADLLFYSGGHPGCISDLLEAYTQSQVPPQHFFSLCLSSVREIVRGRGETIREGLASRLQDLTSVLSFYRHADDRLLTHLIAQSRLSWPGDAFDLCQALTTAGIVGWVDDAHTLVGDDILFRMFVWLTAADRAEAVGPSFQKARNDYEVVLNPQMHERQTLVGQKHISFSDHGVVARWVVDIWYCILWEGIAGNLWEKQELAHRSTLQTRFFDEQVNGILSQATANRDPRQIQESLFAILRNDGEFRFMLNYSLRSEKFKNQPQPYQLLEQRIERFFEEAIRRWSNEQMGMARGVR